MKATFITLLACLSLAVPLTASTPPVDAFHTSGTHVRYIKPASVNGQRVLYISELSGGVSCYTPEGEELWHNPSAVKAVMLEIDIADIDGDGSDELFAASADGNVYCWDDDGSLLWVFNPGRKAWFSEIAIVGEGASAQVYAGGNDLKLYELSSSGKLISTTPLKGLVRKLESGNFQNSKRESLFVMTYSHDKFRWNFFGFLDPMSKRPIKSVDVQELGSLNWGRIMVTDIQVQDLDKDGLEDLLFYCHDDFPRFAAYNGNFNELASFVGDRSDRQRYAHVMGTSLLPKRMEIFLQFGGIHYVVDAKGKLLHKSGEPYGGPVFNAITFDSSSGLLITAGEVSGGNGVYMRPVKENNWWDWNPKLVGRIAEVKDNLDKLYEQALQFQMPVYQKPATKEWVMVTPSKPSKAVTKLNGAKIVIVDQWAPAENFDRSKLIKAIGPEADGRDRRKTYDLSREDILDYAREQEMNNQPFVLWTGHGTDPFYVSIETMEMILDVAPNSCYGFLYAEMHNGDDPRIPYFVEEYLPRLARACRKNGKAKIYFRQKNMFWAASVHLEPWKGAFFGGEFSDILVPAAEDTSSRTQELNLVGRVGMFAGGYVDNFAFRLVDDNPTSWRPLTPGGQGSVSPWLRAGVLPAAYGSRHAIIFGNKYWEEPGIDILYALMASGALPIVDKSDIASIGSWHLIQDMDEELIHDVDDHHNVLQYDPTDEDAVFSVAHMHWAGTNLPAHDFSSTAYKVDYRWTNFVPEMPNGMVPVTAVELKSSLEKKNIPFSISDGAQGFVGGKPMKAKTFGQVIGNAARKGFQDLPVKVSGAAWSAVRIDSRHLRLILMDPGYLEPQERHATITFGQQLPGGAKDILSGEALKIDSSQSIQLTIPAGSMRFIDLTF
ncbi:MAG: hypothetical protein AB3N63_12605 [Puniceicoccaceae bacterium]